MNNRILKFRVWDLKYKYYCTNLGFLGLDCDGILCNIQSSSIKNDYIIQQFTGLIDKNGKEIYEGDIIKNFNYIGEVKFKNGGYFVSQDKLTRPGELLGYGQIYWDEVIGNIFENPELLQKS